VKIRKLSYRDFEGIYSLTSKIYDENPSATWFFRRPSREEIEALVGYKLTKIKDKEAVDYVAIYKDRVVGECEIIKDSNNNGWLGIIIKKGFRNKGLGKRLLRMAVAGAREIGIESIFAEVAYENRAIGFFKKNGFEVRGIENREKGKIVLLELVKK